MVRTIHDDLPETLGRLFWRHPAQILHRGHAGTVSRGGKTARRCASAAGVANLTSGRFAMIENGMGFQLIPWQPVLQKRLDQYLPF
jgi:hypothetical protein